MKTTLKRSFALILVAVCVLALGVTVFAADEAVGSAGTGGAVTAVSADGANGKAFAAAICVGLAAAAGAIAMGMAIAKSAEGISRQPEASDKIRTGLMLGLVFIETAIIYALIVAILIIFVL